MRIHDLHESPAPPLSDSLMAFERAFVYPLGPGRTFRIEHDRDYPRFYRAIGDGHCFVSEQDDRVLGVAAIAIRPLQLPDDRHVPVAYIGDVKVAFGPRRGVVLLRTARVAEAWCRMRVAAAFGIVMDGTPVVPTAYTGRLGIPAFAEVGKVIVFRFRCTDVRTADGGKPIQAAEPAGRECFRRLSTGRYACAPGAIAQRSEIAPEWFVLGDGVACGCLEDTRRAKRLIADDGAEMLSAHFSAFAYRDARFGADLLRHALGRASALGFPALFVAVPLSEADALQAALPDVEAVRAPATVFAHGLEPGPLWNVNTSEI